MDMGKLMVSYVKKAPLTLSSSCLDHFLEQDLYLHCWEMLIRILENEKCHGILLDIGMPVIHRNCRYNCRIIALDGKILLIRPKIHLCNDGNYR